MAAMPVTETMAITVVNDRDSTSNDNQLWRIIPDPQRSFSAFIQSKLNGYVITMVGLSETPLVAYPQKTAGTDNQLWRLVDDPAGSGYSFIESKLNRCVIDILGASTNAEAPVVAYPQKTTITDNQLWRLVDDPAGSGYSFIQSKLNGHVIDIQGASMNAGAPLDAAPQKTSNGLNNGRLEMFATLGGSVRHIWQTAENNGWSNWESLGGNAAGVVAAQNKDGRLEVFGFELPSGLEPSSRPEGDYEGPLLHIWQTAPGNGLSGWASLGGIVEGIAVAKYFPLPIRVTGNGTGQNRDGRIEVFGFNGYGTLFHIWQTSPGGSWSEWEPLGSGHIITGVAVGQNLDGRLEVFGTDAYGSLFHIWQTSPGGSWSEWEPLGSGFYIGWTAVGQNSDGRLEVFSQDSHGTLLHIWQTSPGGGSWSEWEPLGSGYQIAEQEVGQNQDGRLEVFAVTRHGTPLHIWQTSPGGSWSEWAFLGSGHQTSLITVGQNEDGRLEVFDLDSHGTVFHIWQNTPGGAWSTWTAL
jgi:hypothetical protein